MQPMTPDQLEKISKTDLITMVKHGTLSVMVTDQAKLPYTMNAEELRKQFQHLQGVEISIRDAARKYDVHHPTVSRWVTRGVIKVLRRDKNRIMVDEADVAYAASVAHSRPGRGKWLFDSDGQPYEPKRPCD
jgi:hypothetical protein